MNINVVQKKSLIHHQIVVFLIKRLLTMSEHQNQTSQENTHQLTSAEGGEMESAMGISKTPPALQLTASGDQGGQGNQQGPIQKTEEARERSQGGNPINTAVPLIKSNYSSIGSNLLTTHHVAGIVYAEAQLNTDLLDLAKELGLWFLDLHKLQILSPV